MSSIIPTYDNIVSYFFLNFKLAFNYHPDDQEKLIGLVSKEHDYERFFLSLDKLSPEIAKWKNWEFPIFIYNKKDEPIDVENLNFDVFANTFMLLSGWQEWINEDFDSHERFKYFNSLQYKHNFTSTPVVTIYFELLYEAALKNNILIKKKKFSSPFIFTHDIDQLRSGWYEDIGYELKKIRFKSIFNISMSLFKKIFNFKDSYYRAFEKMLTIENKHGIKSLSFFMTKKSHQDGDHDIKVKKYLKLFKEYSSVHEVGIHPGYDTYNNETEFQNQLSILKTITKNPVTKVRQHFLKYNVKQTPIIHQNLGITHDYSLGFAEMYGFRNSIATPFYLFDFEKQTNYNIIQIPLFFMEGTLTHYMKGDRQDNINDVLSLSRKITTDFNISISLLFHNTAFSDKKYNGFTKMYEDFIAIQKSI